MDPPCGLFDDSSRSKSFPDISFFSEIKIHSNDHCTTNFNPVIYPLINQEKDIHHKQISTKRTKLDNNVTSSKVMESLITLPVELVYRIFDHLDNLALLTAVRGTCTRLNAIVDSYHRYQVNLIFCFCEIFVSCSAELIRMLVTS